VPRFAAFPGIRYDEHRHDLALVTAPPYDVIDADERAVLAARDQRNVVHVDLPVGEDAYTRAASTFAAWRADGDLVTDAPSLYLYRMTAGGEATLGVIGALGLEPPGEGGILPHEQTTPKARSDRLDLLRATHANLSAIWGLSLADGLAKLFDVDGAIALGRWEDDDGVAHELWRVDDADRIARIVESVASAPVVIADGHHRYETCLAFAGERPELAGNAATLCFVVELAPDQLTVQPIHRLLHGVAVGALEDALATEFEIGVDGGLALVTPEGTRPLRRREESHDIDTIVLDRSLATLPTVEVTYQHGVDNVDRAVRRGDAVAGVLVRAVTVEQIAATAHARAKLPPKSTFFWPKPRTGTVFRSLD
jgi:uncharacterized protein (DUF1015 family)